MNKKQTEETTIIFISAIYLINNQFSVCTPVCINSCNFHPLWCLRMTIILLRHQGFINKNFSAFLGMKSKQQNKCSLQSPNFPSLSNLNMYREHHFKFLQYIIYFSKMSLPAVISHVLKRTVKIFSAMASEMKWKCRGLRR